MLDKEVGKSTLLQVDKCRRLTHWFWQYFPSLLPTHRLAQTILPLSPLDGCFKSSARMFFFLLNHCEGSWGKVGQDNVSDWSQRVAQQTARLATAYLHVYSSHPSFMPLPQQQSLLQLTTSFGIHHLQALRNAVLTSTGTLHRGFSETRPSRRRPRQTPPFRSTTAPFGAARYLIHV